METSMFGTIFPVYIGIQLPTINHLIYDWVIKFVLSFLIHFFTTLINISTITQKKTIFFPSSKTRLNQFSTRETSSVRRAGSCLYCFIYLIFDNNISLNHDLDP